MTPRLAWQLSTVHGQACEAGCVGEAVAFSAWWAAHAKCRLARAEQDDADGRVLILVACRRHREVYVLDEWSRTRE